MAEIFVVLFMFLIYGVIAPILLCVALRIFVWFAEIFKVPEALGRFVAISADSFRARRAPNE
jgi:hypothetical protein